MTVNHIIELDVCSLEDSAGGVLVDELAPLAVAVVLVVASALGLAGVQLVASGVFMAAHGIARAFKDH